MKKLDLTNKVSPCCKKKITGFNISSKYLGEIDIYRCSYCKGEFTETQILRANIEEDKPVKREDKFSELEKRLEKLENKLKVNPEAEKEKVIIMLDDRLKKYEKEKLSHYDRKVLLNDIRWELSRLIERIQE
jgi:uncharacterized Fe-S cluster-containing protein